MRLRFGIKLFRAGFLTLCAFFLICCGPDASTDLSISDSLPDRIDYNFHVRPILSDKCFACHGPDTKARKAGLRLDMKDSAFARLEGSNKRYAVAPGSLKKSQLIHRITHHDPEEIMPPPESNHNLSPYEIEILKRWIKQGAEYKPHWAFIPPQTPDLPKPDSNWGTNPIDLFTLEKMLKKGLRPKKEADKETLLRRVSLDLTGLPPSIEEMDDFLADSGAGAYEKVVDRLLASPHYGERMALFWLDLARYADSHGYSQDGLRIMWPWRDWVIQSFNENMPYDQFLTWQIAGDKLPEPTLEQKLATGFLRNHRMNGEGGIVDEEYRIEYVADRTETVSTVFMGMTMQCARCHDHKYDPVSQKEYYQLFSFFNQVNDRGISANDVNSGPEVLLTPRETKRQIETLKKLIAEKEAEKEEIAESVSLSSFQNIQWDLEKGLVTSLPFEQVSKQISERGNKISYRGELEQVVGTIGKGVKFSTFDFVNIASDKIDFDRADPFTFSFYLKLDSIYPNIFVINHVGSPTINYPGYEISVINGYPVIRLVHSFPANMIEVRARNSLPLGEWIQLAFTYDGSGKAGGIRFYKNGVKEAPEIVLDRLTQGFSNGRKSLKAGGGIGYQANVKGYGYLDELNIYDRELSEIEVSGIYSQQPISSNSFSEKQRKEHYLHHHQPFQLILQNIDELRQQIFQAQDTLISSMVMEDLPESRPTYVLNRGVYDAPLEEVFPGAPSSILSSNFEHSPDRSLLAKWLLEEQNPLTARVAVNHFWQLIFGQGIVKTTEDFGNQGALPSHPELLDWLAVDFRESNWDVKRFIKRMVMSSTYRQSSRVSMEERASDPANIYLSRGPGNRLSAEQIRDCALAASGLLHTKIGGPSVRPYQPQGLWEEKGEFSKLKHYEQSPGEGLYRRSLYTFWRRTSPPPSMTIFDAPTREVCIVSRQETNTPLQALVLLNDPQFVEAARVLAVRAMKSQKGVMEQIIFMHRLLTGEVPNPEVVDLLMELQQREHQSYKMDLDKADALISVGEFPVDPSISVPELASMTIVASTIMSFDETLMKR